MYYSTYYQSPIGMYLLVASDTGLVGIYRKHQKYFLYNIEEDLWAKNNSILDKTIQWLDAYFQGENPSIDSISLDLHGTDFQKEVWEILCTIPYGTVTTYGAIAQKLAKRKGLTRMSAQAVGQAVGHNPVSILIPCHRVIGSNNSLTGYAGGIDTKIRLLELEGIDLSKYTIPKYSTAK